jgi:hypothetical protein
MVNMKVMREYIKKYPESDDLIYITNEDSDEKTLETIQVQFKLIYEILKDDTTKDEFKELLKESLISKKAFNDFIVGDWKKEPLETQVSILKKIYTNMKYGGNSYYKDCVNILTCMIKELHEYRISQPIPENLIGEVYNLNVTEDYIHRPTGHNIAELYVPYYDVHMNIENATTGFNLFLGEEYTRYKSAPVKTFTIPNEMAKRIHNSAKELVLNRPEIYKYVCDILKK